MIRIRGWLMLGLPHGFNDTLGDDIFVYHMGFVIRIQYVTGCW